MLRKLNKNMVALMPIKKAKEELQNTIKRIGLALCKEVQKIM